MDNSNLPPWGRPDRGYEEWPRLQPEGDWCTEKVCRHFLNEIHGRFVDRRFCSIAAHENEMLHFEMERGMTWKEWCEKNCPDAYRPDDAFGAEWNLFETLFFRFELNRVHVIFPYEQIDPEIIGMFEGTAMAWSRPMITIVQTDSGPKLAIELLLVADWNDRMHARWLYEHPEPRPNYRLR